MKTYEEWMKDVMDEVERLTDGQIDQRDLPDVEYWEHWDGEVTAHDMAVIALEESGFEFEDDDPPIEESGDDEFFDAQGREAFLATRNEIMTAWLAAYREWEEDVCLSPSTNDLVRLARAIDPSFPDEPDYLQELLEEGLDLEDPKDVHHLFTQMYTRVQDNVHPADWRYRD